MTFRTFLKSIFALLIFFAICIGVISINHPIILKWVTGSARHHGKPMPATVYANGQVNDDIKVFYTDDEDNYLVSVTEDDSLGTLKFFNIDLNEKWIGEPLAASKEDYDLIAGHLFQSEPGRHFSPFQGDMKDLNFNPQLAFTGRQIKFNVPPNRMKFDSVRIILP